MTEFNKTTESGLSETKINTSAPSSNSRNTPTGEGLLTIILIALGTLGLYHVGSTYEQPSIYNTNISPSATTIFTPNQPVGNPIKVNHPQENETEITYTNQLIVSGKPEIAQKLAFTIDSFDKNVRYIIDLGNGDIIEPRQKTVYYDYPVSGSYLVELIATYKGQETILYSDFVDIYNSMELVSEVNVVRKDELSHK